MRTRSMFWMFGMIMVSWAGVLTEGAAPTPGVQSRPAASLPPVIAEALEGRKGICLDLGCGDGQLAAAIAERGALYVFALAKDEKDCAAARATLDQAGLYGRRATATVGSPRAIPLPNGYCNLIVTGQFPEDVNLREVLRVLNPNGKAIIGGPQADVAKLRQAATEAGIPDGKPDGNYLVIPGRMPAGADDWTHYRRDPTNNPVSSDASIRPPFRTQWITPPYGISYLGAMELVAQGRFILNCNSSPLYARDSFNGMPLWERRLGTSGGFVPGSTVLVDDRVYVIDGASNKVLVLDASTGKDVGVLEVPETKETAGSRLIKLFVCDGVLYLHADSRQPGRKPLLHYGDLFLALDVKDGRLLWSYKAEQAVDECSVCIGGGSIFFCVQNIGAVCLDLKTGKELWRNVEAMVTGRVDYAGSRRSWGVYNDGIVFLEELPGKRAALDARTGKVLYTITRAGNPNALFLGGKLVLSGDSARTMIYDRATGKELDSFAFNGSNCVVATAGPQCIFKVTGTLTAVDFESRKVYMFNGFRTFCRAGTILANGLAYTSPHHEVYRPYPIAGVVAMAPAGAWQPPASDANLAQRLKEGPAFTSPLATEAAQDDWPCYRHDPRHSACASGTVELPAGKGWQRELSGKLTPPAVAGGLLFVGSSDGHVWALDAATGEVKWKFTCGGSIPVTPTYWKGRLLVGSGDGWVYCLDASTGSVAWSFRAAPEERYIQVCGELVSTWPVLTGVVVEEGVAYFAAGMCSHDGVYLYSIDVQTGRPHWTKEAGVRVADKGLAGTGINPQGALAADKDCLVVPCGGGTPAVLSKKDGRVIWSSSTAYSPGAGEFRRWTGGTEVLLDGDYLMVGGPRWITGHGMGFFTMGDIRGKPYGCHYLSSEEGESGYQGYGGKCTPTWTPKIIFQLVKDVLTAYNRAPLQVALSLEPWPKAEDERKMAEVRKSATLWSTKVTPKGAHSVVAAGSQVLTAGESEVVALDETGQKELGRLKVPAGKLRPNGLAVAKGKAYVVTEEGSVFCLSR